MRFFASGFFHHTSSSGPSRHAQKRFLIFSPIHGVIRILNRLPGDEYTRERIRISRLAIYFSHKLHLPR
jgi:hypothetical protein